MQDGKSHVWSLFGLISDGL
jgi:hypothetical protein